MTNKLGSANPSRIPKINKKTKVLSKYKNTVIKDEFSNVNKKK